MCISELIDVINLHFNEYWINDETLIDYYQGDENEIKKEFIKTILTGLSSDIVVMTKNELDDKLNSHHRSMEGYY